MKAVKFIVGKTNTGFDAYREENGKIVAVTTGLNLVKLRENILESYNLYQSENPKNQIVPEQIVLKFDIASFFEFYKEINASALAKRIGMHKSLLSEYVNGKRKPSDKQTQKIFSGVKALAKELAELEIG